MNVKTLAKIVRSGPYAWPGGYPVYYVTADGAALSHASVLENYASIADAIRTNHQSGGWYVEAASINWEDAELYCDNTGERIPSAYAEID